MRQLGRIGLAALLVTGCASKAQTPVGGDPGVAPALVVERFLRAVNAQDLETMGRLFGTESGSVLDRDPRREVEQRMHTLAVILKHEDYALEGERAVPGRLGNAIQITVRMRFPGRQVPVPFTVVRTRTNAWLVEEIGIQGVTGRG